AGRVGAQGPPGAGQRGGDARAGATRAGVGRFLSTCCGGSVMTRLGKATALCWLVAVLAVAVSDQPAQAQKDRKATFEVYKDKGGAYRWRYKAANGAILATG